MLIMQGVRVRVRRKDIYVRNILGYRFHLEDEREIWTSTRA